MFLYLVLSPAITVFQTYERYQYEYKKTVAISLLVSIASALLAVILVVYCEDKLLGRIIGQVLPSGIIGLCLAGYFVSKGARINLRLLGYALPLALPLVPHGLAGVILGTFDRVMITRMIGFEAAALYSVAYSCGMIIMVLASSLNQAYSPYIGDMVEFQRKGELRRKTMLYVSGFLMFAIIIMLLAPEVLWVLGGENYSAALYAIPVVSLGCVFQFIYTLYVDLELKQKKTIYIAIATLAAAAVNLVLNMVFIPLMGYFGAACTTAIGYGCLLLFHYFIARDIGGAEYFSTAFNCLIACVAVLAALGSSLLYGDQIMRYSCLVIWILAITILVIVKRNEIRGFLDASRKD